MRKIFFTAIVLISFILVGCDTNAGTVELKVNETNAEIVEVTYETIHMNNCGGAGEVKQTAERSKAVNVEYAGSFGVDKIVVKGEVSAKYGEINETAKKIELTAPAGTNMEFALKWTQKTWVGIVTAQGKDEQANYKVSVPISVDLESSQDLGCDTSGNILITPTTLPISISTVAQKVLWEDSFDILSLDNHWLWLGEDPTHWSLSSHPGFLRITSIRNSSVGYPKNLLVQSMPKGNFTIQTEVVFKPIQDSHFAGLIIMQDGNNFLKLGRGYYSGSGDNLYFNLKEQGNWSDAGISIQPTQDDYYLQIIRNGANYIGYASTNGQTWITLGTLKINFAPIYIGLYVGDGYGNADELPADFNFFAISDEQ